MEALVLENEYKIVVPKFGAAYQESPLNSSTFQACANAVARILKFCTELVELVYFPDSEKQRC